MEIDTYHIISTIQHILEAANSNSFIEISGDENIIKLIIDKSCQLNYIAPQINLSHHTLYDIEPIGGLDLNVFYIFWDVMREVFMILDYKDLSAISNVLLWLKNIIAINSAKEFDFE